MSDSDSENGSDVDEEEKNNMGTNVGTMLYKGDQRKGRLPPREGNLEKIPADIPEDWHGKILLHRGHLYATLDFEPHDSSARGPSDPCKPVQLPDNWELAPEMPTQELATLYPWGTVLLVSREGIGFTTTQWSGSSGAKISNYELWRDVDNGVELFKPRRCLPSRPSRVLIRYPAGLDDDMASVVARGDTWGEAY
eukprot:gnl/TRDRNA2_/TRDRNA2_184009_c0_seq1.p1 gnl/TRDRNA2_/TRDRNA2_184009_c0~~gnl/TRDRNA2_/TRDRNA2_184009_c0_seq1.p1  ORF type:complete len:195 (+),score=29.37 gnl/TRDRNA2_/TRDRNA2_184009_c0_seq1:109-693(+)